jgi:hypothetical protein
MQNSTPQNEVASMSLPELPVDAQNALAALDRRSSEICQSIATMYQFHKPETDRRTSQDRRHLTDRRAARATADDGERRSHQDRRERSDRRIAMDERLRVLRAELQEVMRLQEQVSMLSRLG